MVGLQGQLSRLEITSAVIDYEGTPALLITGVEIIPTQTVQQLRLAPEADRRSASSVSRNEFGWCLTTTSSPSAGATAE